MKTVTFLEEGTYTYPLEGDWDSFEVYDGEILEVEDNTALYLAKVYTEQIRVEGAAGSFYVSWDTDVTILENTLDNILEDTRRHSWDAGIILSNEHIEALKDGQMLELYKSGGDILLVILDNDN